MLLLNKETVENYKRRVFEEMQYSRHAFKTYWMYDKIFLVLLCRDKRWKWFSGVKKKKKTYLLFFV